MADKDKSQYMEIDGIEVNPWTHGQLLKLSPTLERMILLVEENGVSIQDLVESATDKKKLIRLVFQFLPFLCPIVSETLSIDPQEVDSWDFDKVARVALAILIRNAVKINQLLCLGNATLKSLS